MDFIDAQRDTYSDLADRYSILADLFTKKLWHQLTIALLEFVRDPRSDRGENLIKLYERFISSFEGKLSQLHFVLIVTQIATQYFPSRPYSPTELDRASAFLSTFSDKKVRLGPAAYAVLQLEITSLKVKSAAVLGAEDGASGQTSSGGSSSNAVGAGASSPSSTSSADEILDSCKKELSAAKAIIDSLPDGEDPVVEGTYYRVAAEYYKLRGPAHLFFESALLYLGRVALDALAPEARASVAADIAIAALVGENVYNFGEVNAQPVLGALVGTPQEWIIELLATFQTGDLSAFEAVMSEKRAQIAAHPALSSAIGVIREKITLLALMEMAARRAATDRSIAFTDIFKATGVALPAIESLVMRAISLGLLKGKVDQVEQVVHVTFVKPRVLDATQIQSLRVRVDDWRAKAATALNFMEEHTAELLS